MKKVRKESRNYYEEINLGIRDYEEFKPYPRYKISWLTDRIDWCWKFRKITESQMKSLCDRMCNIFESGILDGYNFFLM